MIEENAKFPVTERLATTCAILIDHYCMLASYYNRPDTTAIAFVDGWYLMGDLGDLACGEVPGVHPGRIVAACPVAFFKLG